MKNSKNLISSILFYFSVILFTIAFNFSDNPVGNWYQQFMPNLNGQSVVDITFLDSLNGYAITGLHYILKTTNGGDNWSIIYNDTTGLIFKRVQFLNQNTGFVGGTGILKTINGGNNWGTISSIYLEDMSFINNDTGWCVYSESLTGGVFRTTNGGVSWQQQLSLGSQNPNHVYFFNRDIGFISRDNNYIRKTTNSGQNWTVMSSSEGFSNIYFVDSLTGWKFYVQMEKTTDGGLTWVLQPRPSGGNIFTLGIPDFSVLNRDTLWSPSGYASLPNGFRGVLFRTTDGGNSWQFQIPDTAIHISSYNYIEFSDRQHGWVYTTGTGIHTTAGGDPIWYTAVNQISSEVPKQFQLFQNYPNPFNSSSKFKVLITSNVKRRTSNVKVKVYDIAGREVSVVLDKKLAPGEYEITFDAKELPSGVYFYSLFVDGSLIETKKMILLK